MTPREVLILFAGFFFLHLLSIWSASFLVSAAPPVQVSTGPRALFQDAGLVYAECDYAHVFIELPNSELINRTDNAQCLGMHR